MNLSEPDSKDPEEPRDLGVTFSTTNVTGSGPSTATVGENGETIRPSLEVDNETKFIRGEREHIPWSTELIITGQEETTFIGPLNEGEE
jgi:hypothetical protein